MLDAYVSVLSGGTATSWTSVGLATAVPITAAYVFGDTGINSSWNSFQQGGVHLAASSTGADTKRYVEYSEPTYTSDQPFEFNMSIRTDQIIYYKCYLKGGGCQSGGVFVRVNGWEFE